MGVSGLLPVLKPIQHATTLDRYRGKTLAIDTYAWLHKASFCCAEDLVLERPTKAYISYFKKKIDMLAHFQITPYFVFDGDYLPSKAGTEKEREKRRDEYKQMAIEAKQNGNLKLAFTYYQKACDISPEMAKSLINELKLQKIKYVVAPYEADSQMVFLEKIGLVDGIISEDSDLLIFGSQVLITKLNDRAQCIEIRRDTLEKCKGSHISTFTDDQLLIMATISGCDYTKGIPGVGIQKAIQLTKTYKTIDRILMSIKVDGKPIPSTFEDEFKRAKIAFRHQVVFNPIIRSPQHLNPLTEEVVSTYSKEFIQSCTGFVLDHEIHKKIATGELDPFTKKVLVSWEHKVNPQLALRSASLPTNMNSNYSQPITASFMRPRNNTEIPIKLEIPSEVTTKKRKSTMKINQFAQFVKSKKETSGANVQLSPVSKRQRLLNNDDINGQPTISKFFGIKKATENPTIPLPAKKSEVEIRPIDFTASSSDVEDITEDDINVVNQKLSQSIAINNNKLSNLNDDSDIMMSDEEDEINDGPVKIDARDIFDIGVPLRTSTVEDFDKSRIISTSESDFDDNIDIDSSEISESTITGADRTINRNTPFTILRADSSLSLSTEPGDMNTECFIEEGDDSSGGSSRELSESQLQFQPQSQTNKDYDSDNLLDKSNLLAEIYSFKPASKISTNANTNTFSLTSSTASTNPPIPFVEKENRTGNRSVFSPDKWMSNLNRVNGNLNNGNSLRNLNSNKVHRPSPLQQRVPLQNVKVDVNVSKNSNNTKKDQQQNTKNDSVRRLSSLSAFRYSSE